jgi:translation initiation factor IF-2
MPLKVNQLAKDLGLQVKELLLLLRKIKVAVKSPTAVLDEETIKLVKKEIKAETKKEKSAGKAKKSSAETPAKKSVKEGTPKKTGKIEKAKSLKKAKPQKAKPVKLEKKAAKVILQEKKEEKLAPVPQKATPAVSARPPVPEKIEIREVEKEAVKVALKEALPKAAPELKKIQLKLPITVKDLALKLGIKSNDLIKKLISLSIFANINQFLDEQAAKKVCQEFGFEAEKAPTVEDELKLLHEVSGDKKDLKSRAPVVTFMGHVDHGKTSLLDYIRKSRVTEKESGGITQHIGAYELPTEKGKITFLDTPGHEAFTAMRSRGAKVTDLVVLVVAADDGVMPQTIEAVNHARAAEVPIVVAINKCDLPNANLNKVKKQLADLKLVSEDWGGKTVTVCVSAKTGQGVNELLEMILLEAELLELKANPKLPAKGTVVESKLSKGAGPTATVLVQNGTLRVGDFMVCDSTCGKVRAMINDRGKRLSEVYPSQPVEILGLAELPLAGESFYVIDDDKKVKEIMLLRQEKKDALAKEAQAKRITLEDLYQKIKDGQVKDLKIVLKVDVQGSLEAITQSLEKLPSKEVAIKIIHTGVGNINESDIMLAAVSNAVVIGFHVELDTRAKETADKEKVDVKIYKIIYELIEDIRASLEGLLEPMLKEVFLGKAQVRQIFRNSRVGTIAGCFVTVGKITRDALCRLYREDSKIYEGKISSLKRFKDDVREMAAGFECGITLSNFNDIKESDIIEAYQIEKVARRFKKEV